MKTKIAVTVTRNKSSKCEPLDKRTYAPYTLKARCPKCTRVVDCNLAEQYLSYPETDKVHEVNMYCCEDDGGCGSDFKVRVVVRLVVEAAP